MKKKLLFSALLLVALCSHSQTLQIGHDPGRGIGTVSTNITGVGQTINVAHNLPSLTQFSLTSTAAPPTGHTYTVTCAGVALAAGTTGDFTTVAKTFAFQADIIDRLIEITDRDAAGNATVIRSFTFRREAAPVAAVMPSGTTAPPPAVRIPSIEPTLAAIKARYTETKLGFMESGTAIAEGLERENPIHIFLDHNGNNLLGTIPQGVSNRQYIVHIVYPGYTDAEDNITYSIRQTSGSFDGSLLFLNNGILGQVNNNLQASVTARPFDTWHEKTFLLGTATDDLTFEVLATTTDNATNRAVSGVLQTYVIKMAPVYHGSFDIGLINSELSSPTFSLVSSPNDASQMVVKETDGGSRGIVTVMATFYTSPIILLEKLFEKRTARHIPSYKLTGRNLLDDHKFYERIYPAVGVSLSNRTFENLFFGLNWELARGLSLFAGGHWGKVNTFDMPGYQEGVTTITQEQFDFYTNEQWNVKWAYGVKLDILILANLFK